MSDERIPAEHVQAASDYVDHLEDAEADPEEVVQAYRRFLVLEAAYERQNHKPTAIPV